MHCEAMARRPSKSSGERKQLTVRIGRDTYRLLRLYIEAIEPPPDEGPMAAVLLDKYLTTWHKKQQEEERKRREAEASKAQPPLFDGHNASDSEGPPPDGAGSQ